MLGRASKRSGSRILRLESFLYTIGVLSLGFLFFFAPYGINDEIIILCLSVYYIILARSLLRPVEIVSKKKTYLTIELVFVLTYYAVFYWQYQEHLLGITDLRYSTYFQNSYSEYSNPAIVLTTIGLLSFVIGFRKFAQVRAGQVGTGAGPTRARGIPHLQISLLLLLVGFIGLYWAAGWQSSAVGRYTDTTSGGAAANGVYNIILMLSVVAVADLVYAIVRRQVNLVTWACMVIVLIWSFYILVMGDRNSFFLIAAAGAGGIFTYAMQGRRLVIFGIIGGSLLVYNVIEVSRMQPDSSVYEVATNLFKEDTLSPERDNSFSISAAGVRAAVAVMEKNEVYGYGMYQLIGISGVIPFIRGLLLQDKSMFTDTSQVLSYYVLGPKATWSVGTNLVADLYIDLGWFGVVVGLFLIGAFAGKIERWAIRNPHTQVAMIFYIITLAYYSEYARYNLSFPITSLVWAAALIFGLRAGLARRMRAASMSGVQSLNREGRPVGLKRDQ